MVLPLGSRVAAYNPDNKKGDNWNQWISKNPNKPTAYSDDDDEGVETSCCGKWGWWEPPTEKESLIVDFCKSTTIHGLKFICEKNRHISERIFWIVAFSIGFGASLLLIKEMWTKYRQDPVVVTFKSDKISTNTLPFPAVTVCNMNLFPKSKAEEYLRIAKGNMEDEETAQARMKLAYIDSTCTSQLSFAQEFNYSQTRGVIPPNLRAKDSNPDYRSGLIEFLLKETLPCDILIRKCLWNNEEVNCGDLFKPTVTDLGKCCVFNMLPLPLMYKNEVWKGQPKLERWSPFEMSQWEQWDYDENYMPVPKHLDYPRTQKRVGLESGLSILLDPNVEEYFCTSTDSAGFRMLVHSPLEFPHVADFASGLALDSEIFIDVRPDVVVANDDLKAISRADRQCVLGVEEPLTSFNAYTASTCADECEQKFLKKMCNCSYISMADTDEVNVCDGDGDDHVCLERATTMFLDTFGTLCSKCEPLCENIDYELQITTSNLLDSSQLWKDTKQVPEWADNDMTIAHIYFGTQYVVPKLRSRLYTPVDLIANVGALVSLCLGFSALSAVDIIYFLSLRPYWAFRRKRAIFKKFQKIFTRHKPWFNKQLKVPETQTTNPVRIIYNPRELEFHR